MEDRRRILVIGATGQQGGSVARQLLEEGRFAVRALTRDPESEKAEVLRGQGAEVVRGDLDDRSSLEDALADCYGCFGVTNFWEHFGREYEQGKNLIDAVAESNVQHVVFSTLASVKEITNGEIEVPHFDIKAELEEYARERDLPATYVHVAFYFENLLASPPQRQDDGTYLIVLPQGDTPLAGVSVEDLGGAVSGIFERPEEFIGKRVHVVGDELTLDEYASVIGRTLGKSVRYEHIPREVFASFGFPGAEELADMFEYYRTSVPSRAAEISESRRIYPEIQSFEKWIGRHRAEFLNAIDA